MQHHAFVIEAGAEKGIELAQAWAKRELGMKIENNPDIVVLHYGLLSVDDARRVADTATGVAFVGENRVIIIAANRAYHEAQNALLKLFEEPPQGTYLFLVLPTLGSLLPTLRSRVQILQSQTTTIYRSESAKEFLKASKEKRGALIKKLTNGKDEEERRENREEAITLLNGIEAIAYTGMQKNGDKTVTALLADIAVLRDHLYDRSAPVRMILEHISLVIPKGLSADR